MKNLKQIRKDIIIRAALKEFAEYGFSFATTAGIARRAETSVGVVYKEFSCKPLKLHILLETTLEFWIKLNTSIRKIQNSEKNNRVKIVGIIKIVVSHLSKKNNPPQLVKVLVESLPQENLIKDQKLKQIRQRINSEVFSFQSSVKGIIEDGKNIHEFNPTLNTECIMNMLWGGVERMLFAQTDRNGTEKHYNNKEIMLLAEKVIDCMTLSEKDRL